MGGTRQVTSLHPALYLWPATSYQCPRIAADTAHRSVEDPEILRSADLRALRKFERLACTLAENRSEIDCTILAPPSPNPPLLRVQLRGELADIRSAELVHLAHRCGFTCLDPDGPEIMHPTRIGDIATIVAALGSLGPQSHGYVVFAAGPELEHYVQCWFSGEDAPPLLEAVSNSFLQPNTRIARAGSAQLRLLGFKLCESSRTNYYQHAKFAISEDREHVASIVISALVHAYGHSLDSPLDIRVFVEVDQDEELRAF